MFGICFVNIVFERSFSVFYLLTKFVLERTLEFVACYTLQYESENMALVLLVAFVLCWESPA